MEGFAKGIVLENVFEATSLPGGVNTELSRNPLELTSWAPFISGLMV